MKAVIYLRVSKHSQKRMGLRYQRKICIELTKKLGIKKYLVFKDHGISGDTTIQARPGLSAALELLEPGDFLIVANRARIVRDPDIAASLETILEESKIILISAAGEGTNVEGIEGLKARRQADINSELFRESIKQNTKKALKRKKDRGEQFGTIPYGFMIGSDQKNLQNNPKEQKIITLVKKLKKRGHSLGEITIILNSNNYRGRTNQPVQKTQIVNILNKTSEEKKSKTIDRIVPYGYKLSEYSSIFETCSQEQEIILCATQLYAQGYSYRKVAESLNNQGYKSRAGTTFSHTQIFNMLKQPGKKTQRISQKSELIKTIKTFRLQGLTMQSIVEEVNKRGFYGTTGKPLQLTQIARILAKNN
jgi:DNA invertase Pin-like site-specific DNA recombinase